MVSGLFGFSLLCLFLIICGGERGGDGTDAKVGKLDGVLRISFVAESSTQDPLNKKQRCRNAIIFVLNQGRGEGS